MGTAEGPADSKPQHQVKVSSFWIGKFEVTQALWNSVMKNNPSRQIADDKPVENVSWYDAVAFCNDLSKLNGLLSVYAITFSNNSSNPNVSVNWQANGYRLPTEAEWEYAARGGEAGFNQQTAYSGSDNPDDVAWYSGNSKRQIHPVGQKHPNALGIFDMSGNVMEWCYDRHVAYSADSLVDPVGPPSGGYRTIRGGGYDLPESFLRVFVRNGIGPDGRGTGLGFRIVHR